MKFFTLLSILFLSACTPFSAITTALSIGEASQAVKEDKQQPTTIETTIKKEGGEVVVSSTSKRSIVAPPEILEPVNKPKIDIEKGIQAVPLWLIIISTLSGILLFINMLRHRRNNNKGACHDTDRSIDDGRWSSDGRSVQVHGSSAEEQASANGNDDEGSPAAARAQVGRPRVRIQVGRRSSSESR